MLISDVSVRWTGHGRSIGHAVFFAWLVGGILVSYAALAEAGAPQAG